MADKLSPEHRQDEQPLHPKNLTLTGDPCSYRRSFATWDMERITIRWYGAQINRILGTKIKSVFMGNRDVQSIMVVLRLSRNTIIFGTCHYA